MLNKRIGLLALGVLSATHAMANDQADAKGFVEWLPNLQHHPTLMTQHGYVASHRVKPSSKAGSLTDN